MPVIEYATPDRLQALSLRGELANLYSEVYAEPPYHWGAEHRDLFCQRFEHQALAPGFTIVTARCDGYLVGFTFGVTLLPDTPWWEGLTQASDDLVAEEWLNRTFAVVELLVRQPWRRQGVATELHHRLLTGRYEDRATLTVLPAAEPARALYAKLGWHKAGVKANPLPGAPTFYVLVREMGGS